MTRLPIILPLLCASCIATTGDVAQLRTQVVESEERVSASLSRFSSGLDSQDQVVDTVRAAWADNARAVVKMESDMGKRGGIAWETVLAAIAVAVPGAYGLTNTMRNLARAKRGEPVAVPK